MAAAAGSGPASSAMASGAAPAPVYADAPPTVPVPGVVGMPQPPGMTWLAQNVHPRGPVNVVRPEDWQQIVHDLDAEDAGDRRAHNVFPLARMRRVVRWESAVPVNLSTEVPVLLNKAAQMMIRDLTIRAWRSAEAEDRRVVQLRDIMRAVDSSDMFDYLVDIVVPRALELERQVASSLPSANMLAYVTGHNAPGAQAAQFAQSAQLDTTIGPTVGAASASASSSSGPAAATAAATAVAESLNNSSAATNNHAAEDVDDDSSSSSSEDDEEEDDDDDDAGADDGDDEYRGPRRTRRPSGSRGRRRGRR